jgi:hypothetical protein
VLFTAACEESARPHPQFGNAILRGVQLCP